MDLQEARDQFEKDSRKARTNRESDHNSYGGFYTEGGEYIKSGKHVCHAWLADYDVTDRKPKTGDKLKYIFNATMAPYVSEEDFDRFTDWIINRSPWAVIHVDKDVKSVKKFGHLVDANNSPNVIASGLIAARFLTESHSCASAFSFRAFVWKELLNIGCSENEAYIFAHTFNTTNHKAAYPIVAEQMSSWHTSLEVSNANEAYYNNFLKGVFAKPDINQLASNWKGYRDNTINNLWGLSHSDALWNRIKALKPINEGLAVNHNIFKQDVGKSFSYKTPEDFKSIIAQLRELLNRE